MKKEPASSPNIILILADDLGVPQIGCYGSDYYHTPNIDKLAKSGIRFTNAYAAASVCSPTRASILTGKYPARLHLTNYIGGNGSTSPLQPPDWQKFLPLEEVTIAEELKKQNYATAHFGKWHLSKEKFPPVSFEHNPDKQGFDEYFVTYKPAKNLPIGEWQIPEDDAHNVDTITSLAVDFIERKKDGPFILMVSHNSIHRPLIEQQKLIDKYRNRIGVEKEENNPIIAAMMETLDKSTGRIVDAVERAGIGERTVIIFTSDNGCHREDAKQTPFRKGKGWFYDGGIRIPLIVKWPGVIGNGTVQKKMVCSIDLYPTFLDIAGVKEISSGNIDGTSLMPLFTQAKMIDRQTLYWNYPHYHRGSGMKPACAIRDGRYKLIQWYEPEILETGTSIELYDLESDIGEQNNLADELPQKASELKGKLNDWMGNVNGQKPVRNELVQ